MLNGVPVPSSNRPCTTTLHPTYPTPTDPSPSFDVVAIDILTVKWEGATVPQLQIVATIASKYTTFLSRIEAVITLRK